MAPSSLQDYLESKDPPAKKVKHANKTHSSRASSLRAKETVSRSKPPENGSPPLVGVDDLRVPSTHQDVPKDLYHGPTTSHTAVHRSHSKSPQQWEVGLDFDTGLRQTGSIHSPLGSHGNGDGRHPDQLRSLNLEPLPYVYGDAWVQDAVGAILNGQNHESNGREYLGNTPMVQEDLDETQLIAEMLRTNMSLQPSSNELDLPSSVWDGRDIFSDRLLDELFESFREPVVAEPSLDIDVEWDLFEQTTNGLQADDSLSNENQHVEDDEIVAPSSQHPNMEEHNSMPDFTHNTHQPASSQSPPPTETPEPAFSTCPDSNVKRGLDPWHAIPADQNRLSTASTLVGSNPVDNAIEMNLDVESEDENDFSRPLHNVQALVNGNALKGHGPYANFAAPTWTTANGADPRAMKRKPVIVTEASRKRRRRRLSDEARSQNTKDIPTSNDPTHVASDVLEDAGVQLMGAIEQVPFNADDTPIRAHPTTSVADVPMIKIEHSEGLEETPDVVPQKQSQEAMQTLKADEDDGSGKPMDQTTVHCAEASEAEVIQVTKPLNNQNSPQQILPETHNVCSQESTQIDKTAEEAAKALEKAKAMDQVKTWERNKREKARELRRQQIQAQEKAIAVTKKKNAKKQAREQNLARVREKWAKEKRAQRERDREQQILDSHAPQKHLTEEQNEMCGNQHTTVAAPLHRPADITTNHSAAESSEPTTTRRKFRLKFGGKEIVNGLF